MTKIFIRTLLLCILLCNLHSYPAAGLCNLQKPQNLAVNSITNCSASLSWTPVAGAAYYQIQYKQGAGSWNYINTGTNTTWEITSLLANKNYSFSVASFCVNDSTIGYSKLVQKKTLSCSAPEAIVVTGINKNKATIQWQPVCSGTFFNLQYRISGATIWTTISNIATTSIQLTGLAIGTSYEFQLQTNCGSTSSSFTSIQQFTTKEGTPEVKPNILAILLDDGRYDNYQPNGGPSWFETPAINRIANEGVNFQITIPATSQCGPSRSTFYTGLYPHKHGCIINGDAMDSLPLIQQILKDNGYFTGFIGKYGQNLGSPQGFDWWATPLSDHYVNLGYLINHKDTFIEGHMSDVYPQLAFEFLSQVPPEKPFVLFYFHKAPHGPIVPREEDLLLYTEETLPFPSNFYKYDQNYPSFFYPSINWPFDSIETNAERLLEFQSLAGVEYNVDTLMDWLESKNVLDNTFVMYTSDNGFLRGEHLLLGKGVAQEESIRLPMFIRYPKWFSAGTVITDQIASNIDIAPTFLDLAGIPDTFGMDGVSLRKLASNKISRKEFFYEFGGKVPKVAPLRAIRSLQYKYINYYCTSVTEEFFDLVNDPLENNNLIANTSYSGLIQTYRDKLDSFRNELADYEPVPVNCFLANPTPEKNAFGEEQEIDQTFSALNMAPNPANELFSIQYKNTSSLGSGVVTVVNVFGEPVLMKNLQLDSSSPFIINCSTWPGGIYMVTVKTNDTLLSERIMVAH